jgi:hypothetical protein
MKVTVPMLSARPICPCVQSWAARYAAMNGPNPVWTLATKKLRPSNP